MQLQGPQEACLYRPGLLLLWVGPYVSDQEVEPVVELADKSLSALET